MRTAVIATALFAASALAGPVAKRAYVTEITTVVVTVTVPEGYQVPTPAPEPVRPVVPIKNRPPKAYVPIAPPKEEPKPKPKPAPYKPPPPPVEQPKPVEPPKYTPKPEPQPQPEPEPEPQTPGSPPAESDYKGQVLYYHEAFRQNHSAAALTWDDDAAATAQQWANECQYLKHNAYGKPFGQNIYYSSGKDSAGKAVCLWYNSEAPNYAGQYGKDNPSLDLHAFGHFTQVVWKGTQKVGCGSQWCPSIGWYITVCNYSPPGNFGGEYGKNVLPPKGLPAIHAN